MRQIMKGVWSKSGKIPNPGKSFFLKMAADCVRAVNSQRDHDGLNYARKALIKTGMALNLNGQWEERQLFPKLQNIIRTHRSYFEGKEVEEL